MKGHVVITSQTGLQKVPFHIRDSSASFAFLHMPRVLIPSKLQRCLHHNCVSAMLR